jgi:diadenosine tetraphosphate (Ap4A) HIT family hydrolase
MNKSVFMDIPKEQRLYESAHFYILPDKYPISPGHLLIISKKHCADFFGLNKDEQTELPVIILKAKELIEQTHSPNGYNIGMNCGETAGQTVFHFHCHVIPRYKGDMDDPRGGVRHSLKGKGYY